MTLPWENHRHEICDLFLVQNKSLKQVANLMQQKYGFKACERTYWNKIQAWGAQKHVAARKAQCTPRQSIDSGYQSQSVRSCSPAISQYSHSAEDALLESFAAPKQIARQSSFSLSAKQFSAPKQVPRSRFDNAWSPVATPDNNLSNGSSLHLSISQQSFTSNNLSGTTLSSEKQSIHQDNLLDNHLHLSSSSCGNYNRLSSCAVDFCSPHALPSKCFAAHTEGELISLSNGLFSCQHCGATKLHELASGWRQIDLWSFEKALHEHRPAIEQCDRFGNTCVHFAAGSGASLYHLQALERAGAPMKLRNYAGQTFLHVLNTRLYSRDTLPQIIEWALQMEGAMTERDSRNRTVWHSLFQRGISLDIFLAILPYFSRNDHDMEMLDSENHPPLECLRSYWTSNKEARALDYLNALQGCRRLPLYYAVNRTSPIQDDAHEQAMPPSPSRSSSSSSYKFAATPRLSNNVSRLTIGASTKRHSPTSAAKDGIHDILSTYRNGGFLGLNSSLSVDPHFQPPTPPARAKALRVLLGSQSNPFSTKSSNLAFHSSRPA